MTREQAAQMIENMPISHECREFFNLALDALRQPEIVRCKNCVHRGKSEKCVLAAISEEKGYLLFMLDNRGEWFCADGKPKT